MPPVQRVRDRMLASHLAAACFFVVAATLAGFQGLQLRLKHWLRLHALISHFRHSSGLGFLSGLRHEDRPHDSQPARRGLLGSELLLHRLAVRRQLLARRVERLGP